MIVPLLTLVAAAAFAQQQDFSKVEIKVQKVAGTVYMLQGAGGNIGVSVGDDGIVIVDDQFAPLAPKIRAALRGITDKPIKFILNTHYHGDHTGQVGSFPKSTLLIGKGDWDVVSAGPVFSPDGRTFAFATDRMSAGHSRRSCIR